MTNLSLETVSFVEAALRTRIYMLRENSVGRKPEYVSILAEHEIAELNKVLEQLSQRGAGLTITSKN